MGKYPCLAGIVVLLASQVAWAQDAPPPAEPPVTTPAPETAPPPVTPTRAHAATDEEEPVRPAPPLAAEVAEPTRPPGASVGIGAGINFPTTLDNINTASVRLRLASGLTLEPRVDLSTASQSRSSSGGGSVSSDDGFINVQLAALVRFPFASRGPMDLIGIGGAAIGWSQEDPAGNNNNRHDTTLGLVWGLAVEHWWGSHLCFSLNATNPIVTYTSTEQEQAPSVSSTVKTSNIGAVFNPQIAFTIHMFY